MSRGTGTPQAGEPDVTVDDGARDRRHHDRRTSQPRVPVPAAHRRRRGSPVTREALMEFARFLMTRPTHDRVAQYVVTRIMSVHGTRAACISRFGADGSLDIIGSYGMPDGACAPDDTLSLWDSTPMSDAAISGEPIILLTPAEVADEYPSSGTQALAALAPMAVWPLTLPQETHGAMQLLVPPGASASTLLADGSEVAVLLSFYLCLAGPPVPDSPRPVGLDSGAAPGPGRKDRPASGNRSQSEGLTERQSAILAGMAAGQTNAQIARSIGFSESTVRQETMAIYRHLGANGRHDATRLAAERGMIQAVRVDDP